MIQTFFYLIACHFLMDFTLQSDSVAVNKNPNANTELQKHVPWYYWMFGHAMSHGLAVSVITGSLYLGLAETICHFSLDYAKCARKLSIHSDQFMHILCKVVWAWYVYSN